MKKILALLLSLVTITTVFAGCSTKSTEEETTTSSAEFRVTAYATKASLLDFDNFKKGYINDITDVILFGVANFDEDGNIVLDENFETCYENIKSLVDSKKGVNLYVNLLGPGDQSGSGVWEEQMADLSSRHSKAFKSDNLIPNIKDLLVEYDFDGVYFDYEYPLEKKYWKDYNKFIVDLDEALGDGYKIGMALTSWNIGNQSKKAMAATDYVEIMSYDIFDEDGNHSSVSQAKEDIQKFLDEGYDAKKLDLGLPFYGRPTTKDGYWYDYGGYKDLINDDGSFEDSETGLKFYFNTPSMIKEKTSYAIDMGLGGVMIWHWNCDVPYGDEGSLFEAISDVKSVANMQDEE